MSTLPTEEVSHFAFADLRPAIFGSIGIVASGFFLIEVVRGFFRPVRTVPRPAVLGFVGVVSIVAFALFAWGVWSSLSEPFTIGGGSRFRWHGWARGLMFSAGALIALSFALAPLANLYARRRYGVAAPRSKKPRSRKGDAV
jgi:hypothetical protein